MAKQALLEFRESWDAVDPEEPEGKRQRLPTGPQPSLLPPIFRNPFSDCEGVDGYRARIQRKDPHIIREITSWFSGRRSGRFTCDKVIPPSMLRNEVLPLAIEHAEDRTQWFDGFPTLVKLLDASVHESTMKDNWVFWPGWANVWNSWPAVLTTRIGAELSWMPEEPTDHHERCLFLIWLLVHPDETRPQSVMDELTVRCDLWKLVMWWAPFLFKTLDGIGESTRKYHADIVNFCICNPNCHAQYIVKSGVIEALLAHPGPLGPYDNTVCTLVLRLALCCDSTWIKASAIRAGLVQLAWSTLGFIQYGWTSGSTTLTGVCHAAYEILSWCYPTHADVNSSTLRHIFAHETEGFRWCGSIWRLTWLEVASSTTPEISILLQAVLTCRTYAHCLRKEKKRYRLYTWDPAALLQDILNAQHAGCMHKMSIALSCILEIEADEPWSYDAVDWAELEKEHDYEVPTVGAGFARYEGYIDSGGDLLCETMTIEEAKQKCAELEGCKGFTFMGPPTDESVEIYFKNKWNLQGKGWTSYRYEANDDFWLTLRQADRYQCLSFLRHLEIGGRFRFLIEKYSNMLSFDARYGYLRMCSEWILDAKQDEEPIKLVVSRDNVTEGACRRLQLDGNPVASSDAPLGGLLLIEFRGETGEDGGGLRREWLELAAEHFVRSDLFISPGEDATHLAESGPLPNRRRLWGRRWIPASVAQCRTVQSDWEEHFRLLGSMVGFALLHLEPLPILFTHSFLRLVLQRPHPTDIGTLLKELRDIDDTLAKKIDALSSGTYSDIFAVDTLSEALQAAGLPQTFMAADSRAPELTGSSELKEGGASITVTEENKDEYLKLLIQHHLTGSVSTQAQLVRQGLLKVLCPAMLSPGVSSDGGTEVPADCDERLSHLCEQSISEFEITRCGEPRALGRWKVAGQAEGRPTYTHVDDPNVRIYWCGGAIEWRMFCKDTEDRPTLYRSLDYRSILPSTGWEPVKGQHPCPEVSDVVRHQVDLLYLLRYCFSETETEWILAGEEKVDLDAWRGCTELEGFDMESNVPTWFWEIVAEFKPAEVSQLLAFARGSRLLPHNGFDDLTFILRRVSGATELLPVAHTCEFSIDLPEYESKDQLCQRLKRAMEEVGFGVA